MVLNELYNKAQYTREDVKRNNHQNRPVLEDDEHQDDNDREYNKFYAVYILEYNRLRLGIFEGGNH